MNRLGVAIIGAGIGAQHLAAYRQLADKFKPAWICDLDLARAGALIEPDEGIELTADFGEVLADPDVDIVDICLPPHLHLPMTLKALEAGKDVICEKPIACSLAEVDQMQEAITRTGRRVFPVFQYRYGRAMAQLAHLMDTGLAGRAYTATLETHWSRGADYYAVPWRGTWKGEQGGAILGHAIHAHDLITQLLGPATSVSAELSTRVNPIETEDCAAIVMTLKGGVPVTSSVTLGAADDRSRIRIMFEGLTAQSADEPYAPMTGAWTYAARAPQDQALIDKALAEIPEPRPGFAGFLDAVHSDLATGSASAVTIEDARHSIELVTAIYQAARSGQRQSLPLPRNAPLYAGWQPN